MKLEDDSSIFLAEFLFLFLAGLSFRTTKESLRNAFQNFGQLVEGEKHSHYIYIYIVWKCFWNV